ncbi:MAG: cytochrome c [Deltaproteobacteria bacterium]|nr:cytochrome c [Deltaproteobacteria bacterium]
MASWGNLQPLSTEFYSLLQYGLFLVLLIHLPFLGVIIGGSTVSLLLSFLGKEKRDPACLRFSKKMMETVMTGKSALFLFGLVPVLLVWFIYARIFFEATPLPWHFWSAVLAVLVAGFVLLHVYRSALERTPSPSPFHVMSGAAGLLALFFAFFLFSQGYGVLFNPEKLSLLREHIRFFLSWNAVVKYLLFLAVFFGMTGAGVLLLGGRSAEVKDAPDASYRELVRDIGVKLTFLATLVLPVFVLLDLVTLPEIALSATVFATAAIVLLLSLAICLILSLPSGKKEGGPGARIATLYVMIFLAVLVHDHAAVGNAYQDRIAFQNMQARAVEAEHAKEAPRKEPAAAGKATAETGKAVFENNCAGCHQFDIRVVGPPMGEVVPKYGGDVEKLKGFIGNPQKVNPDYPSMPNLGLPEEEIDAVTRYLIGKVSGGGS